VTGAALLLALSLRIQYLAPADFVNEFGCVGTPAAGTQPVLGWSSTLLVLKLDGAVLRFAPEKTSELPTGDERPGARVRQEWKSGPVSAFLDLVRTGGGESSWEGDLTVRKCNGTEVGPPKTIRIRIDCGC
jgi:hypothetical protein